MFQFTQKQTGEILKLFFNNPNKAFYLREISKHLKKEPGRFQHVINKLVKEDFLKEERIANLRYLKLNKEHPLFHEVQSIISKTIGLEYLLQSFLAKHPQISHALIFGSIAKNQQTIHSDIDLLLIGNINEEKITKDLSNLEQKLGREINYHIYSKSEITQKLAQKNDFIVKIFKESIIPLKGNINELKGTNRRKSP